jgi:glycosyltransferase involved in cell wall biosynthesis
MAAIRVYLLTCRRPVLLRRALASLLAQTFTDWVCELHNDAPEDDGPARVVAGLAPFDVRFTYHRHDPPLGAVASFNHCFRGGTEPYAALLEDDNWWEPTLLATLHSALSGEPSAALAWANMRLWRENEDSTWTDTGTTVWPTGTAPRLFDWPVLLQAFEGLHSNGAMLFRPGRGKGTVPPSTPFAIIEPVRERGLPGRLLLVPQVLANFALTRHSARSGERLLWAEGQLLLAGSFLEEVPLTPAAWDELVLLCRQASPRRTSMLMLLALAGVRRREILSRMAPGDFARFAYDFASSLRTNVRALDFRTAHARLWTWLRAETAARTREAGRAGWTALGAGSPFAKHAADAAKR